MNISISAFCKVALACMLALVLASGPALASDTLSQIKESGVLKVAVPQDFPPFGSVGPDMQPIGYDIDMAALIAAKLGVQVKLVPVTSTNRIPYLTTGKVDLVISSLGKNPERAAVIDFSNAYAPFFNGVFGTSDEKVASAADLADKTVAVTRGSIEDLELTKVAPQSTVIKRFEDNSSTIAAYQTGQVDLVATGNVVAASINDKKPAKMLETKFMIKNSPCYVGVAKEQPALMEQVNAIIAGAKKDGSLGAIAEKWLHNPLPENL
ncbi:transporter substrate-binding domain-containing protein [Pseudodesulfovibrio indicus]|uniref:Amino acid ABC transporter substrate-binding protein n=1 Tax=Pseudodesulfovibrio indicus TaxID=1716143 RepID=A0A126QSQ0_9BACT|nr:transporter substrate-binding domain-containing protein [Pseudodesulfovibrio indicus]AMK12766.1 amino acid ABC transporter substrate-binding protein [Pseudodesulfovibrio indicus]TDT86748.1 amino acid ABC transporter substrate-binding protein (PAAT family) [Pseudodesulfovibrio indicus]